MADQKYPDGELAKAARNLAVEILNSEGKTATREELLKAIAQAVRAFQGYSPQ